MLGTLTSQDAVSMVDEDTNQGRSHQYSIRKMISLSLYDLLDKLIVTQPRGSQAL